MPPLVMNDRGRLTCSCWPAPFLFQPTSVTKIASSGAASDSSRSSRAGWIGVAGVVLRSRRARPATSRLRRRDRRPARCIRVGRGAGRAACRSARAGSPSRRRRCRRRPDRSCRSPAGRCRSGSASSRRNREGVLGAPRAAVGFAEGGADRQDDVGVARRLVGGTRAPDARHADRQADRSPGTCPCPSASSRPGACSSSARAPPARSRRRTATTPLPAKITGRLAPQQAARGRGDALGVAGRRGVVRGRRIERRRRRASTCCENTSIGTSISTAPGRPVCARFKARGITSGRNLASSTRHTRLQNGLKMSPCDASA